MIYAPSLWRTVATINFMGTAIDPRPSMDSRYENFWTFYFGARGRKRVIVADRLERIPPEVKGFFYLKYVQTGNDRAQHLIFASVVRGKEIPGRLVSDMVTVYDRSSWTSRAVGGAIVENAGRPTSVSLAGGPQTETADRFLFDVGSHYRQLRGLQRSAVSADGDLIDVESVFLLAGSTPQAPSVVRTAGWEPDGWIGGEARAKMLDMEPARLVVSAYVPDVVFSKAGIAAVSLTLDLDHVQVAAARVTRGGRFRIEANVDAAGPGELVIRCGPTHSPLALGLSADDRDLCVVIDRIVLRKREPGE
jgi:hypothetical protein